MADEQKASTFMSEQTVAPTQRDFFISFNKADRAWAAWVAWVLEEEGYSVWFQDWDFQGNFVLEMDKAHARSRRTIVILSPDYLTSRFTAPEWAARFAEDATSEHDLLIPVRVREAEPQGLLRTIVYVDLANSDEATARQRPLYRVHRIRRKPEEPPFFPASPGHTTVPERPQFPGHYAWPRTGCSEPSSAAASRLPLSARSWHGY